MIHSQYLLDIFDLALDGHPQRALLRKQIPFLTISETNHTGIGIFIYFQADSQIQQFRVGTSNSTNFDNNATEMIDGIEIRNPGLSILADAIVHLKNGIVDHLEIWNKGGEDYVQAEPEHYQIDKKWMGDNKPRTVAR